MSAGRDLSRRERVLPWALLVVPPCSWVIYEYGAVSVMHASCDAVGGWKGASWGLASLAVCAICVALGWPLARLAAAHRPPVRPWLARVATFAAGVFSLAIAFQTLATLIIPGCVR